MTDDPGSHFRRILTFALLIYGVICLVQVPTARRRAAALPQLGLGEFVRRGPVDGEYVTVTGLKLADRGFAFWRDAMSPGDIDVFVPVYSKDEAAEPPPEKLEALLEVQNLDEWERIRNGSTVDVTARVHHGTTDLEEWARDSLAERYSGLRWDSLIVLSTGLHEPTPEKARLLLVHGVVSGIAGIVALAAVLRGRRS